MSKQRQSHNSSHPQSESQQPNLVLTRSQLIFSLFTAATLLSLATSTASAEEPIVMIQEDWKVELNMPDPDDQSPQIITTVSPNGSTDGVHAVFEINHATMPEYDSGGMQLQAWWGESVLNWDNSRRTSLLQRSDETITFTVSMALYDGYLKVQILNGQSQTWGTFGSSGYFYVWIPTGMNNLNSYDPNTSIAKSRVGFASHRVKKFARLAVRKYSADGLVSTDDTVRVVHQHVSEE